MYGCSLGPEDGKGLAAGLAANTTLEKVLAVAACVRACAAAEWAACCAQLDVEYNKLGDEGKAVLQEAVRGRAGFELEQV